MAAPTAVRPTVQLRLPADLLVLAALAALHRPGPAVALVTRSIRDQAQELPRHVLADLVDVIETWLRTEGAAAPHFDRDPWRVALHAVRAARAGARS